MSDRPLQSTLREMQVLLRDGRSWAVLLVLSLIAGMIGPFGTYEAIPLVPRLAYWGAVVVGTAAAGTLVASFVERQLKPDVPPVFAAAIAGAAAGPPIAAVVAVLNLGAFGPNVTVIDLVTLTTYCTLISMAVTVLSAVLGARPASGAVEPEVTRVAEKAEPALLDRLPRALRGRLIHLAVSDHYVEVTTEKGKSLVLIRLSDAIRETEPIEGMQVHRSHWVARGAVRRGLRQGGKPMLELETGTLVPVSRTYLETVRAAGLLDG